ncbi:MAG: hypothetical protein Q7K26_02220 [bacterium]|nr:hypothetical protein [bacterium]
MLNKLDITISTHFDYLLLIILTVFCVFTLSMLDESSTAAFVLERSCILVWALFMLINEDVFSLGMERKLKQKEGIRQVSLNKLKSRIITVTQTVPA